MVLTLADGEAIKSALLARLEQQTNLDDRDYLLTATRSVSPLIDDGVMRIGSWILDMQRGKPQLTYRMPPGRVAALMYVAPLQRVGSVWQVDDIARGEIRLRTR